MINVFQPALGDQELAAVREVFESGWIGRGERTRAFEEAFAKHLGVGGDHVTSLNSCTEALFLAMELLEVGPGCDVVLPTVSWVGAANAVAARGARPVFCDVDPRTLNATADDVVAALTPRTRAVIVLHYGGYPGEVAAIAEVCRERGIALVEDAACAVASRVDGEACGTFGDIGVWSFDAMKIVVAGDGGMLYARDPVLVARATKLAYLGLEQVSGFDSARRGAYRWWEIDVSSFSRRSITNDLAAAIGHVQLGRLGEFVSRRRAIAEHYDRELADVPGLHCPPPLPAGHESSYYLYWVQLDGGIRDAVARRLYERGIYTTFRYPLLHRVPAYRAGSPLPRAEWAAQATLCIPLHQGLDDGAVERVVTELRAAVLDGGR
ncbi:DegT/DnrJ/EryC1/StrS family aminotransferase [Carbonactinospora thermoautotrophica]|uniref:DegT/DnrJ/EryC1/StrS family aminotransferase n=1 Tax=Carbonactinospora thermoautotrophica TaxID=1469144 RepID=UPI000A78BFAC|nr:DegT/DnrJ/EryC1/StrS family aminotransferase [Carbonactinospora thermoautotrophica]